MAAGMGVIDSSGKVGVAMQRMVNHAKAGNTGQVFDHKRYLDNLMLGMRNDLQRKEIMRANQERTAAESALRDSQQKLEVLRIKGLEEKYKNDPERQDKLRRWEYNLGIVKYLEGLQAAGHTLRPGQFLQLQHARAFLSGTDIGDQTENSAWNYGGAMHEAGKYGQRADAYGLGSQQSAKKANAAREAALGYEQQITTLQDFTKPPPSVAPENQAPPTQAPPATQQQNPATYAPNLPGVPPGQVQKPQNPPMYDPNLPGVPPQQVQPTSAVEPEQVAPTTQPQGRQVQFQVNDAVEYKGRKYKVYYRLKNGGIVLRSDGVTGPDVTVSAMNVFQIKKLGQPPPTQQASSPPPTKQSPPSVAPETPSVSPETQPQRQAPGPSPTQTTPAAGTPAQQQPPPTQKEPFIPGMMPGTGSAMAGVVPEDAQETRDQMIKELEAKKEAALKEQVKHTAGSIQLNNYSESQRQTQRDLELTAIGADKLLEERISKRKSAEERYQPSQEMADFIFLSKQPGVTDEQLKTQLDKVLGRTPSDEVVNRVSELMDFYHAHKEVNPNVANLALKGAEELLNNIGKDGTGTTTSRKPVTPLTKVGSSYYDNIEKWEAAVTDPAKIGNMTASAMVSTHDFFKEAMPYIKPKFSQVDGGWWFLDKNVKVTIDDANNAIRALIQVAKEKDMTPSDFKRIMNHIVTIAGKAGGKASKNADDFEKFAVMLHNVRYYGDGSLWRDYSNIISSLIKFEGTNKIKFTELDWLESRDSAKMNEVRWTVPNLKGEGGPGTPILDWVPGTLKRASSPTDGAGLTEINPKTPAGDTPQPKQEYTRFNRSTKKYETITVDSVELEQGKIKRIQVNGKWDNVNIPHFAKGKAVRINEFGRSPNSNSIFKNMKEGTRIVYQGKHYTFVGTVPYEGIIVPHLGLKSHADTDHIGGIRIKDEEGNVRIIRRKGRFLPTMHFPLDASLEEMNAAISGEPPPNKPRPKRQRRSQDDPTKSISERDGREKKNIPVDNTSDPALTMTWSRLADGKNRVTGEFFNATFVNLIPEGATRRNGKPGVWDGDTIYGITVEVPDNNFDGVLNTDDWVEVDGKRVPLPQAWHTNNPDRRYGEFDPKDGTVHMKDAAIRLAGYQAWELKSTDESKDGREARRALLNMFQNGWRDAEDKNRFIFKVRGVGLPFNHQRAPKDKRNPYVEPPVLRNGEWQRWGRIVTDVYVVVGGTRKKIGELTFKNPVPSLIGGGHGERYRKYGSR